MSGTEMMWEAPTQPVEQRQAQAAPNRIAGRVADHGADHGGSADTDRVDRQLVPRRQQRRADKNDFAGQRNAQALHADDGTDHAVYRQRRDRLQERIHGHGLRMPDPSQEVAATSRYGGGTAGTLLLSN